MTRPLLSPDPGPLVRRWGWFLWVTWGVIGTGLLGEDGKGGGLAIGAVLTAPFWVLWMLWPVYRLWGWWVRKGHHERWQAWQGNYYEFDGQQVRVVFDGGQVWLAADDVFDALRRDRRGRDVERARVVAGREGLSALAGSDLLMFSEKGLSAWLDRRQDPEALKFGRWLQQQVIAPYRRRRELEGA